MALSLPALDLGSSPAREIASGRSEMSRSRRDRVEIASRYSLVLRLDQSEPAGVALVHDIDRVGLGVLEDVEVVLDELEALARLMNKESPR